MLTIDVPLNDPQTDGITSLPVALEKLTWKGPFSFHLVHSEINVPSVYVIFLVWDVFEVVVIYFFLVETKGLTLEEINEIFEERNPRAYSERLQKAARAARREERTGN